MSRRPLPFRKLPHSLSRPSKRPPSTSLIVSQTKQLTEHARSGNLSKALHLFDQMPHRNQVTYNAMLSSLIAAGRLDSALRLFDEMPHKNPTSYTSMITGLSRSGLVSDARRLFDSIPSPARNVFSWTAMISCYAHNSDPQKGITLFSSCYLAFFELNILPNSHTLSILLKLCYRTCSLVAARQVQSLIVKLVDDSIFVNNCLIDVNAKLGNLADAEALFHRMKVKDVASYNTMMHGYTHHLMIDKALAMFYSMKETDALSWNIVLAGMLDSHRGEEALRLFLAFIRLGRGVKPNPSTYTIVLTACSTLAMIEFRWHIHAHVMKNGLYPSNIFVCNSLVSLYANWGTVGDSVNVFNDMTCRDVVSWNSLIQGLGQNGCSRRALEVAQRALDSKIFNHNTFTAILSSCSHGGLVVEGMNYFTSMWEKYDMEPSDDHYVCIVDMLGRAGKLEEAHYLLQEVPLAATSAAWGALLNASLIHGNSEIGRVAAHELQTMDPGDARSYLALTNFYSRTDRIEGSGDLFELPQDLRKEPGCSWVIGT